MVKFLRKSQGCVSKIKFFADQKPILRHYWIQNVIDGMKVQVYKRNKENVTHISQCISGKGKKI